jgi:hypothetical protein
MVGKANGSDLKILCGAILVYLQMADHFPDPSDLDGIKFW